MELRFSALIAIGLLVLLVLSAGCYGVKDSDVKTTTTYNLNRETNQVEGTITNEMDFPVKASLTVECVTLRGISNTVSGRSLVENSYSSADDGLIKPGVKAVWKSDPLPPLASGDSYVSCKIMKVNAYRE